MRGPCAKQLVRATIIAADGRRFVGENDCANPQTVCPRGALPSGVGYALCRSVCAQTAHAEVNAIRAAGDAACGGVLYLEGHTHACEECTRAADAAGIRQIIIAAPPHPFEEATK